MCYTPNLLETTRFLRSTLFLTSILTLITNSLAIFCILFKTPKSFGSAKWSMFFLCVWACSLDLYFSLAWFPFLLLPTSSGVTLGFLSFFGVSDQIQFALCLLFFNTSTSAIICLFKNRYDTLANSSKHSTWITIGIYFFNLASSALSCFIILSRVPDQRMGRDLVLAQLPCLPKAEFKVFVLSTDPIYIAKSTTISTSFQCFETLFITSGIIYELYFKNRTFISKNTRKLQKSFFYRLCLQTAIPTGFILIPVTYITYSSLSRFYNQALNNITVIFLSSHGILSAICIVMIHKPYRKYILSFFEPSQSSLLVIGDLKLPQLRGRY